MRASFSGPSIGFTVDFVELDDEADLFEIYLRDLPAVRRKISSWSEMRVSSRG